LPPSVRFLLRLARVRALALSLLGVATLLGGARLLSRRFLFPCDRVACHAAPADAEALTLAARDGIAVHALRLRGEPGAPVLVWFHTNRDTAVDALALGRAVAARGLGVLSVEYRGYGASAGGEPTEEGLYLDAEAALDALAADGVGPARVILVGASLGTGVAAEMARRGRGAALVLVTPYTSIPDVVADAAPVAPARWLVRDAFDTLAKSGEIHVPTLVIHGDADEVVPFWMGERLSRAIAGARLVRVSGGHHGDLFLRERERLAREIAAISGRGT
jgi:hypothetical protein